jgi:arylsulfatase A-like enzyme
MRTMSMLKTTTVVSLCSLGLMSLGASAAAKPNILIILADDMGWGDAGFNGCEDIPTPHIDSIASNGVRFTQGYVTAPQCGPSRAGLLTGMYQNRLGIETNPDIDLSDPYPEIRHQLQTEFDSWKKTLPEP